MNKELEAKLSNTLKSEFEYVKKHEKDKNKRVEKMGNIINLQQVLNNYDELEPVIAEYLNKKAEKERWER